MTDKELSFAESLLESLEEVAAWKRGDTELESVDVDPMPAMRVKQIRKKVSKSTKDFERRFGIPAATINNWEQGRRKPGMTDRLLLKVIDMDSAIVEKAARS